MAKTKDINNYMYRYLEKFIGTYRVMAEYDTETNDFPRDDTGKIDESFEDLYIPCRKGVIKHTYKDFDILACCFYDQVKKAKNVASEIKQKYPKIEIELDLDGSDGFIYFNADDIKKIATIVAPKTSGAKKKWSSTKNLPKAKYTLPAKDLSKLYAITADMDRITKMHFLKSCNSAFLQNISTKKFDAKADMKESRLNVKEYIHSKGKWDDYLKFVKEQKKEV